jgi:hypothetical protein
MDEKLIHMIKTLKNLGYGFRKISRELDISPRQVRKVLLYKNTADGENSFDFNKVVEMLKNGYNHNDIPRLLRPDRSQTFYYTWKENLPADKLAILNSIKTSCEKGKLMDAKIDRSFEYAETNENTFLPIGLK